MTFDKKCINVTHMRTFNPATDAAKLQVKTSFGAQTYTPEEVAVLTAKGWYDFGETVAYCNWKKLVKQDGKFVLFTYMDDEHGGWYDEWSDSVYSDINDVPSVDYL